MNPLMELGVMMAMGRMQRPAGHAVKRLGRIVKTVGQEIEYLGDEMIRTAPPVFPAGTGGFKTA